MDGEMDGESWHFFLFFFFFLVHMRVKGHVHSRRVSNRGEMVRYGA